MYHLILQTQTDFLSIIYTLLKSSHDVCVDRDTKQKDKIINKIFFVQFMQQILHIF